MTVIARRTIFVVCVAAALTLAAAPRSIAQEHQPPAAAQQPGGGVHEPAVAEGHTAEAEHDEGVLPTIARLFNFAALVGLLTYFLRAPIAKYLSSRSEQIRSELMQASAMRASAEAQLAQIQARMKALPGELAALRARGAQEVAGEEARIREAAEAERERLLQHMRREVDLQVRIARRALMEEGASLAVSIARERIVRQITGDDQLRLIDRYAAQVGGRR
jgi:F-type H+-transporting ATPase subunit b